MYYKLNPEKIQKALKTCTEDCDTLMKAEAFVRQLSAELYRNPQAFGQKILSLQEKIVKEQSALRATPNQPQLEQALKEHQDTVAEYLAIARWHMAPEH